MQTAIRPRLAIAALLLLPLGALVAVRRAWAFDVVPDGRHGDRDGRRDGRY